MKIKDAKVYGLSDVAALAQADIQANYPGVDPVIGISHRLRMAGFAADTLTIEHAKNNRRIIMVLHDDQPLLVEYEFGCLSEDPKFQFSKMNISDLTRELFYQWMRQEFAGE